jgi:cold shock CspA family protein
MYSVVKWFRNRDGFGFLEPVVEGQDDIAIHHSEIERAYPSEYVRLEKGDSVSFVLQHHENGPRATQVRRGTG